MKFVLVFLVLFMTAVVNLPDNMIRGLGLDPKYLLAALGAWVFAGLIAHTKMLLMVIVLGLALMVNMSPESLQNMGIDRTYLLLTLLCVAILPLFVKPPAD